VLDGIRRAVDPDLCPFDEDLARVQLIRSEDGSSDLGSASSDQPRDTQDLAPAQLEADVADGPSTIDVADLEDDVSALRFSHGQSQIQLRCPPM